MVVVDYVHMFRFLFNLCVLSEAKRGLKTSAPKKLTMATLSTVSKLATRLTQRFR